MENSINQVKNSYETLKAKQTETLRKAKKKKAYDKIDKSEK